jgi:hypothetical protein
MSWAGPEDVYLSTSLASYLDRTLCVCVCGLLIHINASESLICLILDVTSLKFGSFYWVLNFVTLRESMISFYGYNRERDGVIVINSCFFDMSMLMGCCQFGLACKDSSGFLLILVFL